MTLWTACIFLLPDAWVWLRVQLERSTLIMKEACVGEESPLRTGSLG